MLLQDASWIYFLLCFKYSPLALRKYCLTWLGKCRAEANSVRKTLLSSNFIFNSQHLKLEGCHSPLIPKHKPAQPFPHANSIKIPPLPFFQKGNLNCINEQSGVQQRSVTHSFFVHSHKSHDRTCCPWWQETGEDDPEGHPRKAFLPVLCSLASGTERGTMFSMLRERVKRLVFVPALPLTV